MEGGKEGEIRTEGNKNKNREVKKVVHTLRQEVSNIAFKKKGFHVSNVFTVETTCKHALKDWEAE